MIHPRSVVAAVAAAAALAGLAAAPSALAAEHVQALDVAARLIKQPPGKPWEVNLLLGSTMKMADDSVPDPVRRIVFNFTRGAKVNSNAFATCTRDKLLKQGPDACPAASRLGKGTAVADALNLKIDVNVQVFNGPGTVSNRTLLVYARAVQLPTVVLVLPGKLKKVSGKFGWNLDLPIEEIPIPGDPLGAAVTNFNVEVGGYGKLKGRKVPFIEAPTSCSGGGWPFDATYTYNDGTVGKATALMDCIIRALPGK